LTPKWFPQGTSLEPFFVLKIVSQIKKGGSHARELPRKRIFSKAAFFRLALSSTLQIFFKLISLSISIKKKLQKDNLLKKFLFFQKKIRRLLKYFKN